MVYLTSFPRSGNTFLRYCIEVLSGRPTYGSIGRDNDVPIYKRVDIDIEDESEPVARKGHRWDDHHIEENIDKEEDKLVLILRDFKESFIRHSKSRDRFRHDDLSDVVSQFKDDYMHLIEKFENFGNSKCVVYYEDLIDDKSIKKSLSDVSTVVPYVDEDDIEEFVSKLGFHREKALEAYFFDSFTKGRRKEFHQRSLSIQQKEFMINSLKSYDDYLFNEYLSRYDIDNS